MSRTLRGFILVIAASMMTGCCLIDDNPVVSGPNFLGPDDFVGSFDGLDAPIPMGGQSNFTGDIAVTHLKRTVVDDILPEDLKLAANTAGDPDHPVIVLFGVQHNLQWVYPGGWALPIEKIYNEIMLIVPFVQKDDGDKWHNWVARMYLDWDWAVNMGNTLFGLQKESGVFDRTLVGSSALTYTLDVSRNNNPKWAGEVTDLTGWMSDGVAEANLPNYPAIKQIFSMPILGRMSLIASDPYVCSYFDWNMSNGQARGDKIKHEFLSNFRPNMDAWVNLGGLESQQNGGFGVKDLQWRMTTAMPCNF